MSKIRFYEYHLLYALKFDVNTFWGILLFNHRQWRLQYLWYAVTSTWAARNGLCTTVYSKLWFNEFDINSNDILLKVWTFISNTFKVYIRAILPNLDLVIWSYTFIHISFIWREQKEMTIVTKCSNMYSLPPCIL